MKKKLALMLATLTTVATLFAGCGEKDVTGDYVATVTLVCGLITSVFVSG